MVCSRADIQDKAPRNLGVAAHCKVRVWYSNLQDCPELARHCQGQLGRAVRECFHPLSPNLLEVPKRYLFLIKHAKIKLLMVESLTKFINNIYLFCCPPRTWHISHYKMIMRPTIGLAKLALRIIRICLII